MAYSAVAIVRNLPSVAVAALVLFLTLGTTLAVALRAEFAAGLAPADWAAVRFTLVQAVLSALISVALAVPVARALARRRFAGRRALIALLGAPFILPVIVAIVGLLAVFGRGGIVNAGLDAIGFAPVSIYGLQGVVLAHVFFNLPLATRLLLQGWLSVPSERFRLVATLDVSTFRMIEWPMLRQTVPGAILVIFLICLTSFAVALTLGGGPRATTVELAIYQALRFDFDLSRAALLASLQFVICGIAAVIVWKIAPPDQFGAGLDRQIERWDLTSVWDAVWLSSVTLFLLTPLVLLLINGSSGIFGLPTSVYLAGLRSVGVAVSAALICCAMALALALRRDAVSDIIGVLPLAASSLVVGTGLFLMIFPLVSPAAMALPVTILANAALALPFVLRIIGPPVKAEIENFGRLSQSLGLVGWPAIRIVILPRIVGPMRFALGLAAALSMGDLGVIALFATENQETLPLAMFRLMGAYRMDDAASAGLLLVLLSFGLFWLFDQGGRHAAPK